ncbi:MAG: bifunctional 3-(3-hydroxy-phenyl)propionate/3-hydroxycinnamic acid hydroxylase [Solirubrobacterales bacterium]|nr:bifunctional 3-(3-hydroxy-phenyl)propionate/3-hydroxycinnamic acid hydroxylase [Solirubrobacterales bacterium]MCB8915192.1 bifunctional 3-(3-hydroxy-phenyl)propionate/3-hydroxycinnamic acid hydroxylase [Thermoleophilales bacterium]
MAAEPPVTDCDVLICGLGPVGDLLALLLGQRGVSVVGIDAAPEPYELPRAAVVDDEVLRIYQWAGILDQILAESQVQDEVSFVPRHGRRLTLMEPDGTLQGQHGLVSIHQPTMEQTMIEAARKQSTVDLRWGVRLLDFRQENELVRARVEDESGEQRELTARWMVGADGGTSWVRQLLGIEFSGSTFRQRWLVVDVALDRPLDRVKHPHFFGDPERPVVCLPMSPGRHRWEWMVHPGEDVEPMIDPESIRRRLEPWLGEETAEVERAVVYTFHHRVAERWREGRVLLAGDAAHLTPPFAGQGFSSGARDATNLAWKLEAVLSGAPAALMDSYEAERRPHVEAMIRLAVTMGKFIQTSNSRVAVGRDLLLRTLEVTGINHWGRQRVKPLPAYGDGAFAETPAGLVFKRIVGSQFPQPEVVDTKGCRIKLDGLTGLDWTALTSEPEVADAFGSQGIRSLLAGRDFEDPDKTISDWLIDHESAWVLLRPDQFIYACGATLEEVKPATDQLRRDLGRAFPTG